MSTDDLPVAQIMNRHVTVVNAELPIDQLILVLVNERCGSALVQDANGHAVGSVSLSDVVAEEYEWAQLRRDTRPWLKVAGPRVMDDDDLFSERVRANQTVADLMAPLVHTVRPDTPVGRAAAMMIHHRLEHLIVRDPDGTIVGMVTQRDLTRLVADPGPRDLPPPGSR